MKKIEQLLEHAQNNEAQKFKDAFNTLRNSLNVWENNGASHSEAIAFICGNLIDRYDDLRTFVECYWKTVLTSDMLKQTTGDYLNSILKTFPTAIGVVQQNYSWEHVLDLCSIFLTTADGSDSPVPQRVVTKTLGEALGKLRNTEWLDNLETLQKVVQIGKINAEHLIVTSVKSGNDPLLSAAIQLNGIKPLEGIYVASEWSEKLAELMPVINSEEPSKFASGKKNALRMFPIVSPFINVEQILDCAREDNKNINLGRLRAFVKKVDEWNGRDSFSHSATDLPQIDLILENFELPLVTKHEDLLNKLVLLCTDRYPQAQNWRNLLDRQKLISQIDQSHTSATRKM